MSKDLFGGFAFKELEEIFANLGKDETLAGKAAYMLWTSGFFDGLTQEQSDTIMGVPIVRGSITNPVLPPDRQVPFGEQEEGWGLTAIKRDQSTTAVRAHIRSEWLTIPAGVHVDVNRIVIRPASNNQITEVICQWPHTVLPQPIEGDILKWVINNFDNMCMLQPERLVTLSRNSSAPDGELDLIPGITEFDLYYYTPGTGEKCMVTSENVRDLFLSIGCREFIS